jgi:hypothetical protein
MLFGTLPEALLNRYVDQNPHALDGIAEKMIEGSVPNFVPTLVRPAWDYVRNKTWTGHQLIPSYLEKALPQEQYMDYTSNLARKVGATIGWMAPQNHLASPLVIDNTINDWGGTMGTNAVHLLGGEVGQQQNIGKQVEDPARSWSDVPVAGSFLDRFPNTHAQSILEFQERFHEAEAYKDTVNIIAKRDGKDAALQFAQANADKLDALTPIYKGLTQAYVALRAAKSNPDLPADDKRQLMDKITLDMINMSRQGVKVMNEYEKKQNGGN